MEGRIQAVVTSANQQKAVLVIDNKRIAAAIWGHWFRHEFVASGIMFQLNWADTVGLNSNDSLSVLNI